MKSKKIDVLVAGAGPVGLTTALFLKQAGARVMIADEKANGTTHSYALALHPASLELLDKLGVADAIVAQSERVTSVGVYAGARRLSVVPVAPADARFPFLAVLGQDVLEATLAKALEERGVHVRWDTRIARFEERADEVNIWLDELEESVIGYAAARFDQFVRKTHEVSAGFLVGADGHRSLVRRQALIEFPEVGPADNFAVFEFQAGEDLGSEVRLALHDSGLAVLWPLPETRGRWSFAVSPNQHPGARREKDHGAVQILGPGVYPALEEAFFRQLMEERAPWFNAAIKHVYWRMLVRFEKRLVSSFGRDRIWLAGDAAHLTGPAGIQSMNIGLREARELVSHLVPVCTGKAEVASVGAYGADRSREWRFLLGLDGAVETTGDAAPEIARHRKSLVSCLPASGEMLRSLAGGVGLKLGSV